MKRCGEVCYANLALLRRDDSPACSCFVEENSVSSALMKPVSVPLGAICTLLLLIQSVHGQDIRLQAAFFGPRGDGSIQPGDRPYLTDDGNRYQRGMAFNPISDNL